MQIPSHPPPLPRPERPIPSAQATHNQTEKPALTFPPIPQRSGSSQCLPPQQQTSPPTPGPTFHASHKQTFRQQQYPPFPPPHADTSRHPSYQQQQQQYLPPQQTSPPTPGQTFTVSAKQAYPQPQQQQHHHHHPTPQQPPAPFPLPCTEPSRIPQQHKTNPPMQTSPVHRSNEFSSFTDDQLREYAEKHGFMCPILMDVCLLLLQSFLFISQGHA